MVELVESRRSNFCKSSSMCQTSPLLTRSRLKGSWENPFSIGAICILRLFDTFWRWSKKAVFCLNVKTHIGRYGYFEWLVSMLIVLKKKTFSVRAVLRLLHCEHFSSFGSTKIINQNLGKSARRVFISWTTFRRWWQGFGAGHEAGSGGLAPGARSQWGGGVPGLQMPRGNTHLLSPWTRFLWLAACCPLPLQHLHNLDHYPGLNPWTRGALPKLAGGTRGHSICSEAAECQQQQFGRSEITRSLNAQPPPGWRDNWRRLAGGAPSQCDQTPPGWRHMAVHGSRRSKPEEHHSVGFGFLKDLPRQLRVLFNFWSAYVLVVGGTLGRCMARC